MTKPPTKNTNSLSYILFANFLMNSCTFYKFSTRPNSHTKLLNIMFIALVIFTFFLTPVSKAQISLSAPPEKITQTIPTIENLDINWWQYFKNTDTEAECIDLTNKFIEGLEKSLLQSENKAFYQSNITEITELLLQYRKQRFAKIKEEKHETIKLLPQYSISELIALNAKILTNKRLKDKLLIEKDYLLEKIKKNKEVINQFKLRYSNETENLIEKNKIALAWIEEQIKQALDNIRLSHLEKRDEVLASKIKAEQVFLSKAEQKLIIDKSKIKPALSSKEQDKLKQVEQKIRALNLKLAKNFTDTEESFLNNEIDKLDLIQYLIEESRYELIKNKNKQIATLAQIITNYADISEIRKTIKESRSLSEQIEQSILNWQKIAQNTLLSTTLNTLPKPSRKIVSLEKKRKGKVQYIIKNYEKLRLLKDDNDYLTESLQKKLDHLETGFSKTWHDFKDMAVNAKDASINAIYTPLFEVNGKPVTLLPLIQLIIIILIGYIISKIVTFFISRYEKRNKIDQKNNRSSLYLMHRLIHYFIIFLVAIAGFSALGINLSNITLIAGALSVGIGFGLQNLVSNFVSGLTIMFEKTLSIGDYIELEDGTTGMVKEIRARSTRINTNDNIDVIIPNSDMVTNKVINWTLKESIRRVKIPFGIAYGTDKELVKKAALEAADNVQFTLNNIQGKEPDVWIVEFGENSVNYELLVWVAQYGTRRPNRIKNLYLWELDTALIKYGIEIPFPQRVVHLDLVKSEKEQLIQSLLEENDNDIDD